MTTISELKVGDVVKENNEYVRKHQYSLNGGYNNELKRLGRDRYVITDIVAKTATIKMYNTPAGDDDDWTETVPLQQLTPMPDNPELEAQYKEVVTRISPRIAECLRMAEAAIADAVALADEHGIPFDGPSGLTQMYTPENLPELDSSVIQEITGQYLADRSSGWEHSAVC